MNEKKENRKVQYTKKVLREALLDLLEDKPLEKVTVTEICQLADINRGTFYLHYTDVRDLMNNIEDELFVAVREALRPNSEQTSARDLFLRVLKCMKSEGQIWIITTKNESDFAEKFLALGREIALGADKTHDQAPSEIFEYMFTYVSGGYWSVIHRWITKGFPEPPEQIVDLLLEMLPKRALT